MFLLYFVSKVQILVNFFLKIVSTHSPIPIWTMGPSWWPHAKLVFVPSSFYLLSIFSFLQVCALKPIGTIFAFCPTVVLLLLLALAAAANVFVLVIAVAQKRVVEAVQRLLWSVGRRVERQAGASTKRTSVARHRQAYQHLKVFSVLDQDRKCIDFCREK